jgi:uncharacterized membrane protein YqgA involved in biofilm formation
MTLLIAGLSAVAITSPALRDEVGSSAPVLIVLGAILVGGIVGSLLRLEDRLEGVGKVLQRRLTRGGPSPVQLDGLDEHSARDRFVEGFVAASLVFCVGPLAILGSLSDGLGNGIDQLALKSVLDGFAAVAFAASLGAGVALSALSVAVVQGLFTVLGFALGDILSAGQVDVLTATGGLLLVGVAFRLLRVKQLPVADLLPALLAAPLIAAVTKLFVA